MISIVPAFPQLQLADAPKYDDLVVSSPPEPGSWALSFLFLLCVDILDLEKTTPGHFSAREI